ncbi:MAG TPA: hypothetical protein VGF94_13230 [Kofleriaceae bacterium]|jgi:tetratricopeptide (TPR) repeat protein
MRALVVCMLFAAPAWADSPRPAVAAATHAWQAADHEPDPVLARRLWHEAAIAWDRAVLPGDREDAYTALLAWKHARAPELPKTADPEAQIPLDADDTGFLHALAVYLPVAPGDDATAVQFLRGDLYYRYRRYDDAERDFIAIVAQHPEHDAAEYSANLLLDSLNRQQRYGELTTWVEKLRGNARLLAAHPDLRQTLQQLHDAQLRH